MDDLSHYKTYKIGEAARLLGVKPYVLRFWESEFEQIEPIRKASGQRAYTDDHLQIIRRIQYLLHEKGLTIEGAKKQLAEDNRAGIMRDIERELLDMRAVLLGQAPTHAAHTDAPQTVSVDDVAEGTDNGTALETPRLQEMLKMPDAPIGPDASKESEAPEAPEAENPDFQPDGQSDRPANDPADTHSTGQETPSAYPLSLIQPLD